MGSELEAEMMNDPDSMDRLMKACAECGGHFKEKSLAPFGKDLVCGSCKKAYTQKLREGLPVKCTKPDLSWRPGNVFVVRSVCPKCWSIVPWWLNDSFFKNLHCPNCSAPIVRARDTLAVRFGESIFVMLMFALPILPLILVPSDLAAFMLAPGLTVSTIIVLWSLRRYALRFELAPADGEGRTTADDEHGDAS